MINLTNCNGTKQESKCLLIFILTRRFSHQKLLKEKNFQVKTNLLHKILQILDFLFCLSLFITLAYHSLKPCLFWLKIVKKVSNDFKVFDWHCRILILTCTVDFGNNGPNCNVSLLIKGFTNSLLLVAYFFSPCKIIFIYILIETFKMYYIVKTNHFQ